QGIPSNHCSRAGVLGEIGVKKGREIPLLDSRRGPNELGIPYRVELDLKIREIPVSRIIHGHMKPQDSQKVERKIRLLAKLIVHPLF
ncbi:MAG TPA: hypothetical protein VMW38_04480, partial [Terriglobia bacterium]|nr:hypothetical protein [Terriglobia bacterium]